MRIRHHQLRTQQLLTARFSPNKAQVASRIRPPIVSARSVTPLKKESACPHSSPSQHSLPTSSHHHPAELTAWAELWCGPARRISQPLPLCTLAPSYSRAPRRHQRREAAPKQGPRQRRPPHSQRKASDTKQSKARRLCILAQVYSLAPKESARRQPNQRPPPGEPTPAARRPIAQPGTNYRPKVAYRASVVNRWTGVVVWCWQSVTVAYHS
jgi:hypothetical protein